MTHDVFKKKPTNSFKVDFCCAKCKSKGLSHPPESVDWVEQWMSDLRPACRVRHIWLRNRLVRWRERPLGRVGAALSSSFKQQDARVGVRSSAAEYFYFFRCVADAHCSECPRWRFSYVPWRAVIVLCRCQDGRSRPLRLSTTTPLDTPAIKRFITDWRTRLLPSWRHLRPFKYFHLQVRHFQVNNLFESILIEFSTFNRILTELADRWR